MDSYQYIKADFQTRDVYTTKDKMKGRSGHNQGFFSSVLRFLFYTIKRRHTKYKGQIELVFNPHVMPHVSNPSYFTKIIVRVTSLESYTVTSTVLNNHSFKKCLVVICSLVNV